MERTRLQRKLAWNSGQSPIWRHDKEHAPAGRELVLPCLQTAVASASFQAQPMASGDATPDDYLGNMKRDHGGVEADVKSEAHCEPKPGFSPPPEDERQSVDLPPPASHGIRP